MEKRASAHQILDDLVMAMSAHQILNALVMASERCDEF